MMQRLANDPSFWLSVWTLVGLLLTAAGALVALLIAWAKAKTAEYEAKSAKGTAEIVAQGQGVQQVTLVKHGEQIAALEAVQGAASPGAPAPQGAGGGQPALSGVIGLPGVQSLPPTATGNATPMAPFPAASAMTPTGEPVPPSASPPAPDPSTAGAPLGSGIVPSQNGYPPPPET